MEIQGGGIMPYIPEQREYRAMPVLLVANEKRLESDYYIEGYATTFNDDYVLWEMDGVQYKERISSDALNGADLSDVIMQYDHSGRVMARQSNKTLIVEPASSGLFVAADLSRSSAAKELYNDISEGLVTKMSWAFTVADEEYDKTTRTRIIKRIKKVYDVSAVSCPANPSTDISARSYAEGRAEAEKQELQERVKQEKALDLLRRKLELRLKLSEGNK